MIKIIGTLFLTGFILWPFKTLAQDAAYDYAQRYSNRYFNIRETCSGRAHPTGTICFSSLRDGSPINYMIVYDRPDRIILSINPMPDGEFYLTATSMNTDTQEWVIVSNQGQMRLESQQGVYSFLLDYFRHELYTLVVMSNF